MPCHVALLRGINIGPNNRIAMPALRDALTIAGHANVRTYVQSGNIVLDSELGPSELQEALERLIADRFELSIPTVVRSQGDLARAVTANPFPEFAAQDPKRFQVSFLRGRLHPELPAALTALASPSERIAVTATEIYTWHADGVARSKLWAKLGARSGLGKGVTATSRNWTTVTTLLEMTSSADAS